MIFADQEIQVLVDTIYDHNLIWKNIADHLRFKLFFSTRAATQADGILLKEFLGFCERIKIMNLFGALLNT